MKNAFLKILLKYKSCTHHIYYRHDLCHIDRILMWFSQHVMNLFASKKWIPQSDYLTSNNIENVTLYYYSKTHVARNVILVGQFQVYWPIPTTLSAINI